MNSKYLMKKANKIFDSKPVICSVLKDLIRNCNEVGNNMPANLCMKMKPRPRIYYDNLFFSQQRHL